VLHLCKPPAFVTPMAWEKRGGRYYYYYRSVRDGERVRKEYVGAGEFAEGLASSDETMRLIRELEREKDRAEVEHLEDLAAPVLEIDEGAEILTRAALVASGYYRHKGEWRQARER
jgi:hypothetical protein